MNEPVEKSFGCLLIRIRLKVLGMTQVQFAELLHILPKDLEVWERSDVFDSGSYTAKHIAERLWRHLGHPERMELISVLGLSDWDEVTTKPFPFVKPEEPVVEEPIDFELILDPDYLTPDRDPLLGLFALARVMEKHTIAKPEPKVKKILAGNIRVRVGGESYLLNEMDVFGPDKGSLCMRVVSITELQMYRLYKDRAIWEEVVKFEVQKMKTKK